MPSTNPIVCQFDLSLTLLSISKPLLFVSVAVCHLRLIELFTTEPLNDINSTGTNCGIYTSKNTTTIDHLRLALSFIMDPLKESSSTGTSFELTLLNTPPPSVPAKRIPLESIDKACNF